jgi:hypothetical protein
VEATGGSRIPKRFLNVSYRPFAPAASWFFLVFHDGMATSQSPDYFDRRPSIEALKLLFERFSDKYRFVTVPELGQYGHIKREKWLRDSDPAWLNKLIEEGNLPGRQYPLAPEMGGTHYFKN